MVFQVPTSYRRVVPIDSWLHRLDETSTRLVVELWGCLGLGLLVLQRLLASLLVARMLYVRFWLPTRAADCLACVECLYGVVAGCIGGEFNSADSACCVACVWSEGGVSSVWFYDVYSLIQCIGLLRLLRRRPGLVW